MQDGPDRLDRFGRRAGEGVILFANRAAVGLYGFKHVNDTLGHAAGDALLIDVAQRLEEALNDGDLLARQGWDEFVVLTRRGTGAEATRAIGQRPILQRDAFELHDTSRAGTRRTAR